MTPYRLPRFLSLGNLAFALLFVTALGVNLSRAAERAEVVATGPSVRQVEIGDRVLFDADDRHEVELQSKDYVLLRERDIHAIAARRVEDDGATGLYL